MLELLASQGRLVPREQLAAGEESDSHLKSRRGKASSVSLAGWPPPGPGASAQESHWTKCAWVPGGTLSSFCLLLMALVWEAGRQCGFVRNLLARSLGHGLLSKRLELGPTTEFIRTIRQAGTIRTAPRSERAWGLIGRPLLPRAELGGGCLVGVPLVTTPC